MLKYYDSIGHVNWVTDVRTVLYSNGYGYVWESQNVPNRNHFINNFVNRLKDQYIQINNNPKLVFYKDFKQHFGMELYVSKINISKFRRALAMFRSSAHSLMVEKGRHYDIQGGDRHCVYCETIKEDEYHIVLLCPLYENLRMEYIPIFYLRNRTHDSFVTLMSCKNAETIKKLCMYLYFAFEKRNDFLVESRMITFDIVSMILYNSYFPSIVLSCKVHYLH